MELSEAIKASDEAAQLVGSEFIRPFSRRPIPLPGVGVTAAIDSEEYRLVFYLATEADRPQAMEICKKMNQTSADIHVTGGISPFTTGLSNLPHRNRPVLMGDYISRINNPDGGTLGCFVEEPNSSKKLLLSCTHVLAPLNQAAPGDLVVQPVGSSLVDDAIATLHSFIPLKLNSTIPDSVGNTSETDIPLDAAIAEIVCLDTLNHSDRSLNIRGQCSESELSGLISNEVKVFKMGSTTQKTSGLVKAFKVKQDIPYYDASSTRWILCNYQNFFTVESNEPGKPFADYGDSGSLIYDEDGVAVGLVIGGNNSYTYALPIDLILRRLNVTLILN